MQERLPSDLSVADVQLHGPWMLHVWRMAATNLECRKAMSSVKIVVIILQEIRFCSSNNKMWEATMVWVIGMHTVTIQRTSTCKNETPSLYLNHLKAK